MNPLENFTFRTKAILAVFVIVSMIIVMYVAAYRPKMSEMLTTQSGLKAIVAKVDEQMRIEGSFSAPTADDISEWNKAELELSRRIPESMNMPVALESIAALAKDVGIEDISMVSRLPGKEDTGGERFIQIGGKQYRASSEDDDSQKINPLGATTLENAVIEIAFHCEYRELAEFLEGLCRLPRFIVVQRVAISRELPEVSVRMSVKIFSLPKRAQTGAIAYSG